MINVEYNQLDPLLRSQGDCKGDVADPSTGYSPYPGNANNLVIGLEAYAKTLRGEDQGVVLEFVNPKYKDETRTDFKKPTRLECMMQDLPKLFQKELGSDVNIGYTMLDRWFTFSPAKVRANARAFSRMSFAVQCNQKVSDLFLSQFGTLGFLFPFRIRSNPASKQSERAARLPARCPLPNPTSTSKISAS